MPSPLLRPLPARLRHRALAAALGMAGFLVLPGLAQAQSLQSLYDAARDYDATYRAARSQAESTVFKAEQARAANRPVVAATGTVLQSVNNTPYSSTTRAVTGQQTAALTAQQVLFNRVNDRNIDQADRGIAVAQSQLRASEQDLIVRVVQAYFDVLSATDALATIRASKAANAEQLASAKRNFEVGTATITDTREAQARYDLVVAQELAADNDLNNARLALDTVSGRTGAQPLPLAVPVVLPTLAPADVEAWVTEAEANSPSLQQLRLALDVARLETAKARAGHLPTVAVSGTLTEAHTRLSGDLASARGNVPFGPSSGTALSGNVALTLNMPIYSGYSVQNRIKETLALEEKAQGDLEAARRTVGQGTRTAFFGVRSLVSRVAALEAAESSSKLALEATQLGYKVGVRVNLDVLNAQSQLYQAQRDLAKARYDVIVNNLKLRQAAGTLQAQDVGGANALLAR